MAQTALAFDLPCDPQPVPSPKGNAAVAGTQPDRDDTAFELGWDHAHHGLVPPAEHLLPANPVRQGWEAGRASFGNRTLKPTRHVRKWLQLRLQAWKRGRAFEGVQVTPHYLAQIDTARCPITRQVLTHATGEGSDASVDRVYNDAAYAAGNLAVISLRANQAKGDMRWDEARTLAVLAEARSSGQGAGTADGLASAEWARLAILMSFVTPLPHELAATLPLLVLPPNRLRLLNPIQGLQALITLQLTHPGFAARSAQLAALIPGKELKRDYQLLFHSLLPRAWDGGRPADAQVLRERLEDAWRNPLVLRRWQRFARQLSAEQAEALVQRAAALGLGGKAQPVGMQVVVHAAAQATEGWALDTAGYEAPAAAARSPRRVSARRVPQAELPTGGCAASVRAA